jgi:hypothetical protein
MLELEDESPVEFSSHKHAIQQTFFLSVYEPGGNRVGVGNAGTRLILAPDWKPIVCTEEERRIRSGVGLKTFESFPTQGTPAGCGLRRRRRNLCYCFVGGRPGLLSCIGKACL